MLAGFTFLSHLVLRRPPDRFVSGYMPQAPAVLPLPGLSPLSDPPLFEGLDFDPDGEFQRFVEDFLTLQDYIFGGSSPSP
eukprot:m.258489 g.258489  ORF g.258489 m.258489 type:complete len:80 (+) comp54577_c1_seq34:2193-2432(+)